MPLKPAQPVSLQGHIVLQHHHKVGQLKGRRHGPLLVGPQAQVGGRGVDVHCRKALPLLRQPRQLLCEGHGVGPACREQPQGRPAMAAWAI